MRSLPTDPRDADTGSRFSSLGDAPFYRGLLNNCELRRVTALIFASDGQLELLRSCRLVYVDCLRPVHPSLVYNKLNMPTMSCEVHHLAFHIHSFSRVFQSCSLVPRFPTLHV